MWAGHAAAAAVLPVSMATLTEAGWKGRTMTVPGAAFARQCSAS